MTFRLKPIAAALAASAALGFAPGAFAQMHLFPTNPIMFDADGTGGVNSQREVQTFDWSVSSLLSSGGPCPDGQATCNQTLPITDLVNPSYLRSITHAALQGFQNADGDPDGAPTGLNTTFEITFVAGACTAAQPAGLIDLPAPTPDIPQTLNFTLNPSSGCTSGTASGQYFEIWYDDLTDGTGTKSNALEGTGFRDGKLILSGSVIELAGANTFDLPLTVGTFDQYITNDYPGVTTLFAQGSVTLQVQINALEKAFFRSGVEVNSFLPFTGQVNLPYRETNPSKRFYTGAAPVDLGTQTALAPDHVANIGIDGDPTTPDNAGPNVEQQADASNSFTFVEPLLACRVTGGGNDSSGLVDAASFGATPSGYDDTTAADQFKPAKILKAKGKKTAAMTPYYYYTFGGQAGANTALLPQPKGQWEHNQHSSPTGLQFAFHAGKRGAVGTQIDEIRCTDPGWCKQARPAPDKEIDFVGIGTFSDIKGNAQFGDGVVFDGIQNVVPTPGTSSPTYHWFQVHIEDLGEPGSEQGLDESSSLCPAQGSGNNPFANPSITDKKANCDCRDFYRLTIYKGNKPKLDGNGKVVLDVNGDPVVVDGTGTEVPINKSDKIYEVYGYIEGGNFQIHPLTGFDLQ